MRQHQRAVEEPGVVRGDDHRAPRRHVRAAGGAGGIQQRRSSPRARRAGPGAAAPARPAAHSAVSAATTSSTASTLSSKSSSEVSSEHHALGGLGERRDGRVVAVAAHHLVAGGLDRRGVDGPVQLGRAAPQPRLLGCREQHPHPRVGGDDGGDVAPLGHHSPGLLGDARHQVALQLLEHRAHLEVRRDRRDRGADLGGADRLADVGAADRHGRARRVGADLERELARGGGHGIHVGEVETALEAPPGERAVHRPGVEVADAEPAGHGPARRCSCPSRRVRRSRSSGVRSWARQPSGGLSRAAASPAPPGPWRARRPRRARRRPRRARTAGPARGRGGTPRCWCRSCRCRRTAGRAGPARRG